MIEWIIGLSLSLLLFSVYAQSAYAIRNHVEKNAETIRLHQEAAAFYHYLEREMAGATRVAAGRNRLVFLKNGDWLEYAKQGETIVRERDGRGYVTVCYFVQDFSIHPVERGALIRLALKGKRATIETETIIEFTVETS